MKDRLRQLLGHNIRRLRKAQGLTIQQLADLSQMDAGFLTFIELSRKTPSLDTLAKIAEGLKVPISDLFNETERKKVKADRDDRLFQQFRYLVHDRSPSQKDALLDILRELKDAKRIRAVRDIIKK